MNNILSLKKRVMARIYVEYTKNILLGHSDYFMLLVFMVVFFTLNSIGHILTNIPKDNPVDVFNFLVAALEKTDWIIQALLIGFLARVLFVGSKFTYKNIKNSNLSTGWLMSKLRY